MIRWLDQVVSAPADQPLPLEIKEAMQRVTRQTAFDPSTWTPERAAKVAALFDGMAAEWNERQTGISRYDALVDALERGDVGTGTCVEIGSGSGLATPLLVQHFGTVVGLDLSAAMIVQGSGRRVQGDANHLPFATGTFDAAVLVNALLFPREVDRVVAPDGVVLWVNTRGDDTPIHLPPEDVAEALPGEWSGAAAAAGLGIWAVLRRR
ncbi:MAG: class I SAM-dependent methyltransferase [Actinobacteria bacterium]|nr:class I SAM-dependent methyltransferase [Actinomycetota bacterium]